VAVNTNPDSAVTRRLSSLSIPVLFWQFRETGMRLGHSASDFDTDAVRLCTFCVRFWHRYGQHIFDDTLSGSRPSRNTAIQDHRECASGERSGTANAL